ncbi:energy transducer TonB [Flavobacterium sp. SUN052]|uniref:energy transducer TonB n=1 Tax=Flavobacterium sp. SUN052 TaxID=3002441 RepID=UPI00237E4551|nr:energy transducer TonB [Flavobacterium sp. SUN052]MEC4005393.1 energy transducer TonB [Flavobacterium sp. SUN052]
MRKTILFFIVSLSAYCNSQTISDTKQVITESNENSIYRTSDLDIKPEFPGGIVKFYKYISSNFSLPPDIGKVKTNIYVSFVVEKDGSISEIKVLKGEYENLNTEAIRVVKSMPNWIPGKLNGIIVRCNYQIPIVINAG